ncbi:MAG: acyltransferase family protein [Acidimicrobiia bacterium]
MSTGPTTAPPRARLPHQPALDGLRALAVIAVMLFHAGVGHTHAGFIGVDVFLVLSGFLITTLLWLEIGRTGRVAVKDFWMRRARRLLPALIVVLLAVAVYGAFVAPASETRGLRGDLLGSLFYVQNWRLVLSGQSYFAQFGSPSPLRHMWSLAIEEQWYLVWPLAFLGIVRITRANQKLIAIVVLGLAGASALLMAALYDGSGDASRVYYGTDTRAQALLIGAALAILLARRRERPGPAAAVTTQLLGLAGIAYLVWVVTTRSDAWTRLYRGGFLLIALAAGALIAAATAPGPFRRLLALPPLPAIGLVSYGLYLWHWPVYVVLTPDRSGLHDTPLLLLRLAATTVIAVASFVFVERPIREQRVRWVRGRVAWIPITSAVTAAALIGLTAVAAPATLSPQEAARRFVQALNRPPAPGAKRLLIVGDSIAFTLATAGVPRDLDAKLWLHGEARIGCGLFTGSPIAGGVVGQAQDGCSDQLRRDAAAVRRWKPDVGILLVGGWEVFDRRLDGRTLQVGTPPMEAAIRNALEQVERTLTARGARFVILTTPCFSPTRRNLGEFGESERSDPTRVEWLNDVWRRYAADHPEVRLLDLDAHACPGGHYADKIHAVTMRTDGVHFTEPGAALMWRWLGPQLLEIATRPR